MPWRRRQSRRIRRPPYRARLAVKKENSSVQALSQSRHCYFHPGLGICWCVCQRPAPLTALSHWLSLGTVRKLCGSLFPQLREQPAGLEVSFPADYALSPPFGALRRSTPTPGAHTNRPSTHIRPKPARSYENISNDTSLSRGGSALSPPSSLTRSLPDNQEEFNLPRGQKSHLSGLETSSLGVGAVILATAIGCSQPPLMGALNFFHEIFPKQSRHVSSAPSQALPSEHSPGRRAPRNTVGSDRCEANRPRDILNTLLRV